MIKKQLKNIFLTLIISTLALTACGGGSAEATPTMDLILIQTQAVETFSAVLTQTALAAPSDTPVPTQTVAAPTVPPLATNTSSSAPRIRFTVSVPKASRCLEA